MLTTMDVELGQLYFHVECKGYTLKYIVNLKWKEE